MFRNARVLGVGTKGFSLWGQFGRSKDGSRHRIARVAIFGGDGLPKPSAVVMAYTGHSDYSPDEPSTFVVVEEQDGIA